MIKTNKNTKPYYFKEGCYITELWNETEDKNVSVARVTLPPMQQTRSHFLKNTTERYLITSGIGLVFLDDKPPVKVSQGDVVLIHAGTAQSIKNTDEKSDLEFLAICSPRFEEKNYAEP